MKANMNSSNRTGRNNPCPCGSRRKYKQCCQPQDRVVVKAKRKMGHFTMPDGSKVSRSIIRFDSIPTHNKNGLTPDISSEQMMDLCLDKVHTILKSEKVGMLPDLVDTVIEEMDIVPTFTYRQILERMMNDERFETVQGQICGLEGTDPVELMADTLKL
jgi:hypothetical protein